MYVLLVIFIYMQDPAADVLTRVPSTILPAVSALQQPTTVMMATPSTQRSSPAPEPQEVADETVTPPADDAANVRFATAPHAASPKASYWSKAKVRRIGLGLTWLCCLLV